MRRVNKDREPSQLVSAFHYDSPKIAALQDLFAYAVVAILSCMRLDAYRTHAHRSVPCNRDSSGAYRSPAS
jgi:hypothetical protein